MPNEQSMVDHESSWNQVRRLADELELKIHLAGMDVRDRWKTLRPQLEGLELRMKDAGQRVEQAISDELEAIWNAMRGIDKEIPKTN